MAEYNPSKIIKDGNTYNFRDTTKIPLAGTNALAGSIVPNTDNAYDLGGSTYRLRHIYAHTIISAKDLSLIHANDNQTTIISGGLSIDSAYLLLCGKNYSYLNRNGNFLLCATNGTDTANLQGTPSGTLTWKGQAIQTVSDQRLKQQIAEIDDKLLDAWQDVNLVQFKYNDAVEQKSDNARLHTGYVVQQIDEACKSHGVDISEYGLYCHEVYQEETREVEHEDGTKTTEVVLPASEHYSLRYTEALIVECAYLRKCIKELRTEIEELKSSK